MNKKRYRIFFYKNSKEYINHNPYNDKLPIFYRGSKKDVIYSIYEL